ncbi:MAG TPA: PAS domain-containing protein [Noviherbaspirillum sp.]|uniref:PAS domain-containing protein n=1 Tax=Noviherbaspirillum sp. TaxID=1926288 RepID=UPI002B45E2F6|nr:PAS domain-containing protein [Noviherbaspirillum sp.]HJV86014.1 PAS domain-containing protein [Noviherbaspirillum sp.]
MTPMLAFAGCLAATIMLTLRIQAYEETYERFTLEQRADAHIAAIRHELDDVVHELQVLDWTIEIFGPVTQREFEEYLQPVFARYPHIRTFNTEFRIRGGGQVNFNGTPRPASQSTVMWAHQATPGSSDDSHRRTFTLTLPSWIGTPIRGTGTMLGNTSAVVDIDRFLAAALRPSIMPGTEDFEVHVQVHVPSDGQDLDFHREHHQPASTFAKLLPMILQHPAVGYARDFQAAGMTWHLSAVAQPAALAPGGLGSQLTLFAGTLFSVMIGLWMHLQVSRAQRIQRLVDTRTRDLQHANDELVRDIAAREQAESDLRQAQHVLTVAQKLGHLGSWEVDVQTDEMHCSDELFRICGLEPQSITPTVERLLALIHPEDRDATRKAILAARDEGKDFRLECRILRPDGSIRHMISVGEAARDRQGWLVKAVGSMLDITEHKHAEMALRRSQQELRELAAHQERIREDERKRIAREVHDALGSVLAGVKAYLSVSISRLPAPDQLLTDAAMLVDRASETVREVVTELRPSVLDQLGVWEALRWHAQQTERRSQIVCECLIDENLVDCTVDPDRSIAIFRIVQEALTNVLRHAQAWWVSIRAMRDGSTIVIEIEDNGKGGNAPLPRKSQSFGIIGMNERARYLGGDFELISTPGKGTLARLRLPLGSQERNRNDSGIASG